LKPLHVIRDNVEELMRLYDWDVITIAISPFYCGGVLEANMILETVTSQMGININKGEDWPLS